MPSAAAGPPSPRFGMRQAMAIAGLANLAYFGVEFAMARHIGSVSLLADSIDFLEDTFLNALVLLALGWSPRIRARIGMVLAAILLVPVVALIVTMWQKLHHPLPPEPFRLSLTGLGALLVNLGCALLLARFRDHHGSLSRAAFFSARNDALANVGIIAAGLVTMRWPSVWPDFVVGLAIAGLNADAASKVWRRAHQEHRTAPA